LIKVILPGGFLQERAYAIHVLLYEFLGLTYSIEVSKDEDSYCIEFDGNEIRIADCFFDRYASAGSYLITEALPQIALSAKHPALDGIICIYGEDLFTQKEKRLDCGVDLIAGAFFMLTRWEEYVDQTRDQHGRFPAPASLAMRAGFLHRPVVNEYAVLLKKWLLQLGIKESAFKKRTYQLSLHCDVDTALYWPSKFSIVNKVLFQLVKQHTFSGAWNEIRQFIAFHGGVGFYSRPEKDRRDPYDTYDKLMDLAEKRSTKACFCFLVDGEHALDDKQMLHVPHVRRIFDHIRQRGHDTGIHFSYRTADDAKLMQDESKQYQTKTGLQPANARQHFLRCSVPGTWRALEKVGVTNDFTMGYPESLGFRCGTCYPFPLFDVVMGRMLHVYERPLIAMDVTLKFYREYTPEQAVTAVRKLADTVRSYDGEFVLLWHNSSFGYEWEGWENVLEEILRED